MAADDSDAAARLIERLLADRDFRVAFRRDPAMTCRAAGLDELADEMAAGAGKAMHTLEMRESRSSVAGVMMAAAFEGIGLLGFAEHVVPRASAPGPVRDVLSRVNLPVVDQAPPGRGALAPTPEVPPGDVGAEKPAGDAGAHGGGGAPAPKPNAPGSGAPGLSPGVSGPLPAVPVTKASEEVPGAVPETGSDEGAPAAVSDTASDEVTPAAVPETGGRVSPVSSLLPIAPQDGLTAESIDYPRAAPLVPEGVPASPVEPQGGGAAAKATGPQAPVDPEQFGADGTGGTPSPEALALLDNDNVVLDAVGVADIKAGRIDPRVVAVLSKLSEEHEITVSSMCSDHSKFTSGGSISNHYHGRGMDIAAIDGMPVNPGNPLARKVATALSSLAPSYRPDEIGTPWPIAGPGYFTDAAHADHLHVAFKRPIDPSWKPPADVVGVGAPAATPVLGTTGGGTLSLPVAAEKDSSSAAKRTLSLSIAGADETAGKPPARTPVGASAGDALVAGDPPTAAAGARARGALAEAMKHKGTPYLWGGSTPQTGFDCSGLVQWAYAKQGIEIPRVTDQQILASNGTPVERRELAPGDLVFFRDETGYVYHVGISMGGDRFLHAPRTGDVVKESSLSEPYFAQRFTGARRFDSTPAGVSDARPVPEEVAAAGAALTRDAVAASTPGTMVFKALNKQEASYRSATVQFIRAVRREDPEAYGAMAASLDSAVVSGPDEYPGDGASKQELASWLAAQAQKAGLPPELPVMAALVESGLANLPGGHADSVGFFQMRVGIWNKGQYAGYPDRPELQIKWFIDHALAVKRARIAAGNADFGKDPSTWGTWIADVERPAAQYRGRYQPRLAQARALLGRRV